MITRHEIESELEGFLVDLADSIDAIYGMEVAEQLKRDKRASPLWSAAIHMYEYAVEGIAHLDDQGELTSDVFCAIHFFEGWSAAGHGFHFGDFAIPRIPSKVIDVAELAHTRNILDGGSPYLIFRHGADEEGTDMPAGFLSIADVARLANMDTKSVRNAAGPRAADRLVTQSSGKSTWVAIDEARRWLNGRKGFNPTKLPGDLSSRAPSLLFLPPDVVQELQIRAAREGESIEALMRKMLSKECA